MIKITFGEMRHIFNSKFLMGKLVNTPLNPQISYKIKKILDRMENIQKGAVNELQAILQDLPPEAPQEDKDKLQAARDAYDAKVIEIDRAKLSLSDLQKLELSVGEISMLGSVIQDPEEAPASEPAQVIQMNKSPA